MRKRLELSGIRFNNLIVIECIGLNKNNNTMWKCKCDCGNETVVNSQYLKNGHTKSCGCQKSKSTAKRNYKHGTQDKRIYRIWALMKDRCKNPNTPSYKHYGGRGISVCDEWQNDFVSFYNWSMSNGYEKSLTIDRINNDGNYEPSNCRWATMTVQNNNKRKSNKK